MYSTSWHYTGKRGFFSTPLTEKLLYDPNLSSPRTLKSNNFRPDPCPAECRAVQPIDTGHLWCMFECSTWFLMPVGRGNNRTRKVQFIHLHSLNISRHQTLHVVCPNNWGQPEDRACGYGRSCLNLVPCVFLGHSLANTVVSFTSRGNCMSFRLWRWFAVD